VNFLPKKHKKKKATKKKGGGGNCGSCGVSWGLWPPPTRSTIPHKPHNYPHRHFSCSTASKLKNWQKFHLKPQIRQIFKNFVLYMILVIQR